MQHLEGEIKKISAKTEILKDTIYSLEKKIEEYNIKKSQFEDRVDRRIK